MGGWLPDTAIIIAILTVATGLFWNFHNARAVRKQPFLALQLEHCFAAVETVAVLSTTCDREQWHAARDRFWQLYYGPLAVVEGREVERAMVACSQFVPPTGEPHQLPNSELCGPCLELSQAVRQLLIDAWNIKDLEATLEGKSGVFDEVRRAYAEEFARQMQKGKDLA